MRPSHRRWAGWILACVLPPRELEAVIGDLEEEYAFRSRSLPLQSASWWYWSQIVRSVPLLLLASVRRGGWLATLTTAVGACLVQAIVELTTKSAISTVFAHDARLPAVLALLVTIPTLVLVSYLATRIRPGAAAVLTALIVIAVLVQLVVRLEIACRSGIRLQPSSLVLRPRSPVASFVSGRHERLRWAMTRVPCSTRSAIGAVRQEFPGPALLTGGLRT